VQLVRFERLLHLSASSACAGDLSADPTPHDVIARSRTLAPVEASPHWPKVQ